MPAPICAAFSVIPYTSYHKSGLLRKDFSDRDFHPYLTYVFWGKGLSTMLFPLFFFFFFLLLFPHAKHKSDCDAAVLSRELYNGFGPGLWCRKLRSMRSCVKERAAVTQNKRHGATELW